MRNFTYLTCGQLFLYSSAWETHAESQGREIKNSVWGGRYAFMSFSKEVSRKLSFWYRLILIILEDISF